MNLKIDKIIFVILSLGLIVRILFLFYGADVYYGNLKFETSDTESYTQSFINLIEKGHYTFMPENKEAAFGRLPGYPFFFGIHYLLFGAKNALLAVAITQLLLDTINIFLLGAIAFRISGNLLANYITAFIYAVYPFSIVLTTITATESLSIFLISLWLYLLLRLDDRNKGYILVGITIAVCFFVREFLGIILPITCLYVFLKFKNHISFTQLFKRVLIISISFMSIYMWWPIRNYVYHEQVILIKPSGAGYLSVTEDVISFMNWYHSWSNDDNKWFAEMISDDNVEFPEDIFASEDEKKLADSLVALSRNCGTGFYFRKNKAPYPENSPNCNSTIAAGFTKLKTSYKKNHPIAYYFKIPLLNLQKAFFKSNIEKPKKGFVDFIVRSFFATRSILLVLGVLYLFYAVRKKIALLPILLYFLFIYPFICFYLRSLEMRYIIHADVLLLIPAGILLALLIGKINARRLDSV